MSVEQLIEKLMTMPLDAKVRISLYEDTSRYAYGELSQNSSVQLLDNGMVDIEGDYKGYGG